MKFNKVNILAAAAAVILVGCATPKPGTPEFVQKKEDEQQKAAVKTVEQTVSKAPAWFTQPPVDSNAIYQTATMISTSMQASKDNAIFRARKELARQLGARVSEKIKEFVTESGNDVDAQVSGIINSASFTVTNDQNVAGYTLEKSEFVAEGDKYRAYVLIRYPVGENNKVIAAQIKKNALLENKVKASKAWEDLKNEIEKAKKK